MHIQVNRRGKTGYVSTQGGCKKRPARELPAVVWQLTEKCDGRRELF